MQVKELIDTLTKFCQEHPGLENAEVQISVIRGIRTTELKPIFSVGAIFPNEENRRKFFISVDIRKVT